jgi:uncharacterized protein YkwD
MGPTRRIIVWTGMLPLLLPPTLFAIDGQFSRSTVTRPGPAPRSARPTTLEEQVLEQVNWARMHPDEVADYLDDEIEPLFSSSHKLAFHNSPTIRAPLPEEHGVYVNSVEGVPLIKETVKWLHKQRALPPVMWDDTLGRAAADMVRFQGPRGETGHDRHGVDWMRIASHENARLFCCGEVIMYGASTPRSIVVDLIVDDGVPSRGHRAIIFDSKYAFNAVGIAVGPHESFRSMCVIDWGVVQPEPEARDGR